jgi:uncharacterized protein (TIGR02001 family)
VLRGLLLATLLSCALDAFAEVSGTATLISDYRYRGYSLSSGQPTAQAGINYDDSSGCFAAGMLAGVRFEADSGWELQSVGSVGVAGRLDSGLGWEGGASYASFSASHDYDYGEAFVGISFGPLVARLFYAPDYYRQGLPSAYLELDATHALTPHMTLDARLGIRRSDPWGRGAIAARVTQFDFRLGLNLAWRDSLFGVAWLDGTRHPLFADSSNLSGAGSALEVTLVRPF